MKMFWFVPLSLLFLSCTSTDETQPSTAEVKAETATPAAKVVTPVATAAKMQPTKGHKAKGTVKLFADENGLKIEVAMEGVPPGVHGIHIHEKGDCSAADASSAGNHFNPTTKSHGAAEAPVSHAGDLGNVTADKKKKVVYEGVVKTGPGYEEVNWEDIVGKAVVLHAGKDDLKSQPAGNAGARVACGVIEKVEMK